jgi:hypothetical protein
MTVSCVRRKERMHFIIIIIIDILTKKFSAVIKKIFMVSDRHVV